MENKMEALKECINLGVNKSRMDQVRTAKRLAIDYYDTTDPDEYNSDYILHWNDGLVETKYYTKHYCL